MSMRPSHPAIGWRILGNGFVVRVHVDRANAPCKFISKKHRVCALNDLKWKGHVISAWHTGVVTLELGITGVVAMRVARDIYDHALFGVGLFLRQRFGLVRNFAALHDALSARPGAIRTHKVRMRAGLRIMVLNINICRDKSLPDAAEVGFAISGMRRFVGRELTRGWNFVLSRGRTTLSCGGTASAQNENSRNCKTRNDISKVEAHRHPISSRWGQDYV